MKNKQSYRINILYINRVLLKVLYLTLCLFSFQFYAYCSEEYIKWSAAIEEILSQAAKIIHEKNIKIENYALDDVEYDFLRKKWEVSYAGKAPFQDQTFSIIIDDSNTSNSEYFDTSGYFTHFGKLDKEKFLREHRNYVFQASQKDMSSFMYPIKNTDTLIEGNIPPSAYQISEKEAYAKLLLQQNADILIAPCTVDPSRNALDWIERFLIAAQLERYIHENTGAEVADLFIVSRALGEGYRKIDKSDIKKLAKSINAKYFLTCQVGHDGQYRMNIKVERNLVEGFERTEHEFLWHDVKFDDVELPHIKFKAKLPESFATLDLDTEYPAQSRIVAAGKKVIGSVKKLASGLGKPSNYNSLGNTPGDFIKVDNGNITENLWRLEFLGSLFPKIPAKPRERVFMRALLAAYELPEESMDKNLLLARAYYYLNRRPAAIATLSNPANNKGLALLATLNGNLPELEQAIAGIGDELARWIAVMDLFDIRHNYGKLPQKQSHNQINTLAESTPGWELLLERRLAEGESWILTSAIDVKRSLDRDLPVAGYSIKDLTTGGIVLGDNKYRLDEHMDIDVAWHLDKLLNLEPERWCCGMPLSKPIERDLHDLYKAVAESSLIKRIKFQTYVQGIPQRALSMLDATKARYSGHPDFERLRMDALIDLADNTQGQEKADYLRAAEQSSTNTILWSAGQSISATYALYSRSGSKLPVANSLINNRNSVNDTLTRDFPTHWYWPDWSNGGRHDHAYFEHRLAYTCWQYWSVEDYLNHLIYLKEQQQLDVVINNIGDRFTGNIRKTKVEAERALRQGDEENAISILSNVIKDKPVEWNIYNQLAKLLLKRGEYEKAYDIYNHYPGFSNLDQESRVLISNSAYEAGSYFYWRGKIDKAEKLYKISVEAGSASGGDITSQIRLAILEGDFKRAAELSLDRGQRYPSPYAFRDYLSFLFTFGYSKQAWAGFKSLAFQFDNQQVWAAALVGQRIDNTQDKDLRKWLESPEISSERTSEYSYAANHAILHYVVDREPPDDFASLIEKLEGKSLTKFDERGRLVMKRVSSSSSRLVGPSKYKDYNKIIHAPGKEVPHETVIFAQAYTAWKRGNTKKAAEKFDELAQYYFISPWILPYFSAALSETSTAKDVEEFFSKIGHVDRGFDWHLAMAYYSGATGKTEQALEHLDAAFHQRPHTDNRPIFTQYQWAEACEWLMQKTGDPRFRDKLLNWVQVLQKIQPFFAWPYAIDAQLADSHETKIRALSVAQFLDPQSIRLRDFSKKEKREAAKYFETNNPFHITTENRQEDTETVEL